MYPRKSFDLDAYAARVRGRTSCFICSIVAGELGGHAVVYRDDVCVAFLAKWPTLVGCTLVAPLEHRTDVVRDFELGNAHVHWHLAPLPPGVPYEEQQYAALMHEHGYFDIPRADEESLARTIAARIAPGSLHGSHGS